MTFSGHDTFHCRLFWLKKGIDYLNSGESFRMDSGVDLGVGKNMVNSMRFWLKSFDACDDSMELKQPYKELFLDGGWDPYLENQGTLYLLHYKLCMTRHSSIYYIIFNNFRKVKPEFTQENLIDYIKDVHSGQNEKILAKDFSVFRRMYGQFTNDDVDDGYSGLLTELGLLREVGKNRNSKTLYRIENNDQKSLPEEILLYCILTHPNYTSTISFSSFYSDDFGIGNTFCLNRDILEEKLQAIAQKFPDIIYSSEAGVKELQVKKDIEPNKVLEQYYGV